MHFNPYGGAAAQLAAALVNLGPGTSPGTITEVLREHDYRPFRQVNPAEAAELLRWADRLRPVFADADLDHRVEAVNALLAVTVSRPYISRHDGRAPHLHFAHERGPIVDRLRAYTASGLAHAICEDHTRLGVCDRPGCGVAYVDTSRNGRRRFCGVRCANRVYVAGHRSRTAAAPAGSTRPAAGAVRP
ncbi:CGNR zinc finger domain-containing protein [Streptosporangium sandarakinum]|uniref:CGNR zinc finger domain-containing protein n=1 Tax=Streptosporangium sandarakinum TaxID=1260955 RepID=UPI00343F019B